MNLGFQGLGLGLMKRVHLFRLWTRMSPKSQKQKQQHSYMVSARNTSKFPGLELNNPRNQSPTLQGLLFRLKLNVVILGLNSPLTWDTAIPEALEDLQSGGSLAFKVGQGPKDSAAADSFGAQLTPISWIPLTYFLREP